MNFDELYSLAAEVGIMVTPTTTETDITRALAKRWVRRRYDPSIPGFEIYVQEPTNGAELSLWEGLRMDHLSDTEVIEWSETPISQGRRAELIAAQRRYANEVTDMNFAPADGKCWSCGADIVDEGYHRSLPTGCPKCQRSYCD